MLRITLFRIQDYTKKLRCCVSDAMQPESNSFYVFDLQWCNRYTNIVFDSLKTCKFTVYITNGVVEKLTVTMLMIRIIVGHCEPWSN